MTANNLFNRTVYPWHNKYWEWLEKLKHNSCLPYALLLHGIHGTGTTCFAFNWVTSQLCTYSINTKQKSTLRCGQCHDCLKVEQGYHPNLLVLGGDKKKVSDVELLNDFLAVKSLDSGSARWVFISCLESISPSVLDMFLKKLEEPTPRLYFVMVTHKLERLPLTLKSRCFIIKTYVNHKDCIHWLKKSSVTKNHRKIDLNFAMLLADNAPLDAEKLLLQEELPLLSSILQYIFSDKIHHEKIAAILKRCTDISGVLNAILCLIYLFVTKATEKQNRVSFQDSQKILEVYDMILEKISRDKDNSMLDNAQMINQIIMMANAYCSVFAIKYV